MVRRCLGSASLALPLSIAALSLTLAGCGEDDARATSFSDGGTGDFTTGDGDGDGNGESSGVEGSGDGDGDSPTTGDGDGDTTTGDGDGDTTGDGDGDTTGDGDGDTTTGDGDGDAPCQSDADCVDPDLPICAGDGTCIPCTPDNDVCPVGQYCTADNTCVVGCTEDLDCGQNLVCDVDNNTCTGCVIDGNCPLGSVCSNGDCIPGCTEEQPCQDGFSCCGGDCQNLADDPNNCGDCNNVCPDFPNAADLCTDGGCTMGDCEGNYNDCDGNPDNGCETQAQCACVPGSTISCYTGFPADTEGVGVCQAGLRTCNAQGTGYGACVGQVIPGLEICANNLDDNCNGQTDENPDLDQDGWGACDNDCCDQVSPECSTPNLVNPGAFEVSANNVDDDCDGMIDNPLALCDAGLAANSGTPNDYAKAIDLCQFTTENPPLAQKKWGVITSWLHRGNGAGNPSTSSRSIRPQFGNVITPQMGQRIAVMSSGAASYPGAPAPTFQAFQNGFDQGAFDTAAPADWLAANGGTFPNAPGCPAPGSTNANDSVMYKVRVRVPTNANSFSVRMYFFSAEYPEYVCTAFNDLFISLVDTSDPENPVDKNIAIYTEGNNQWPVGVNLLQATNGLFQQCSNGTISQCGTPSVYNGCVGTNQLNGTGFDTTGATSFSCLYNGRHGGGTGWLTMSGNVTPGETMEIRFVIWDSADSLFDSLVLLDNWQWSVQASEPGVTPG